MATTSRVNLTYVDKFAETASVGMHVTQLTAGNFTAENGLIDDLITAISAVTLLELVKDQRLATEAKFSPSLPTDTGAVKGVRWLVRATDSNGNNVGFQIPGADLGMAGTDKKLDLTTGAGATLKSAIEAVVKSNDGETIVVQEILYLDK